MMSDLPTYDATAAALGWAPEQQRPPLDLVEFMADRRAKARAHVVLMLAADPDYRRADDGPAAP